MNTQEIANKLNDLIKKINEHPGVQTVLAKDEFDMPWLQTTNAINGHIENVDPELNKLLSELDGILCEELIDQSGQHSKHFYELSKFGFHCRTGERDSFGPLSSVLTPPSNCWRVCYG